MDPVELSRQKPLRMPAAKTDRSDDIDEIDDIEE
jgi:hypothetical protein